MIKQVSVMKRHPDLSMDEFIDAYENRHAKFGKILFAKARRFQRRYVQPERNPLTGEVVEMDFDVIMEIWWDSRKDYESAMQAIPKSGMLDDIKQSGARLFASANNPAFTVLEYETNLKKADSR